MSLPTILAVLVIGIGVPLNAVVTVLLWRMFSRAPDIKVLRERFIAEAAVLVVVLVFGLIFINNDLVPPSISTDATKLITRATMLGIAIIPACYWLWLYRGTDERGSGRPETPIEKEDRTIGDERRRLQAEAADDDPPVTDGDYS